MGNKNIRDADFYETGYSYTLSLIAGKYKPIILYCLMEYEPVRFNEMQRYLKKVADKTLSQNLKELEADDLIVRHSRCFCFVMRLSLPFAYLSRILLLLSIQLERRK